MSTTIAAPYPDFKVTCVLPSPKFGDERTLESTVDVKVSKTGARTFTYVNSSNRQNLRLPMELAADKALELQEFVRVYYRARLYLTLHDGSTWEATLASNPFGLEAAERAGGWPGGELVRITLEFSARQLAPPVEQF